VRETVSFDSLTIDEQLAIAEHALNFGVHRVLRVTREGVGAHRRLTVLLPGTLETIEVDIGFASAAS
jgi:hypothetical protein